MENVIKPLKAAFAKEIIVSFLLLIAMFQVKAQQGADHAIQANIIYRFTKYIDWPADKKSGDFVIGIVGDSPLYDALKGFIVNKTAGTRKIVIKKYSPTSGVFDCQILFVSDDESNRLKKIAASTLNTPILLVTESDGMARKGSCINFIIVDDHLKLEINKTNIEKRNLNIASELLQLGIPVK